jgi:hypothetical protein
MLVSTFIAHSLLIVTYYVWHPHNTVCSLKHFLNCSLYSTWS